MTQQTTPDPPRVPMQPVGFSVQCPCCDCEVDVDHVGQRDSGAWSVWASGHPEAGHVQCDFCGEVIEPADVQVVPVLVARLPDAYAELNAWASSEIGRLKAIIRVNALRWAPHLSHAEIDEVINGKQS